MRAPLGESVVAMALDEALRAWPWSLNTFEISLADREAPRPSHLDHCRTHEDQERRRRRRRSGTSADLEQKQVQEEASVHYFQMGTENPICCSSVDNFSAGAIYLFQCMEVRNRLQFRSRACRSCGSQVAIGGSCVGAVSFREGSYTTCISAIVHIPHFLALCR